RRRLREEALVLLYYQLSEESCEEDKSEMDGTLVNMFDDETEEREETSFMDLPDDILINIFNFLDFPSRFKLRLNRRLDQLQFC
ncbi:hypothetical protein PENTCL1PPCAC_7770, partial [Pristionchus entomophagus]